MAKSGEFRCLVSMGKCKKGTVSLLTALVEVCTLLSFFTYEIGLHVK